MQQLNPEELQDHTRTYGAYTGDSQSTRRPSDAGDQKLDVDSDEQFADILARRIKQELRDEMKQRRKDETIGYRLALAIVSISILVPLFITLVVALASLGTTAAAPALIWGFFGICGVIFAVNAYFNWASTELKK